MNDDEPQIIELLEQRAKCISTIDDRWITEWASLIEKYFKNEARNHIRLKAVALLSQIFSKYHVICGEELMNKIILPNFNDADQETDSVVRKPIVHLLFDIASVCLSYKHCNAILAVVRKMLTKPFRPKGEEHNELVYIIGNVDIIDSRLIISNLNKLFKAKLHRLPIDPAVNMLDISVNYLNLTYKLPLQGPAPAEIPMIRRELFSFFLSLRCNKHGHLGMISPIQTINDLTYSPFIICVKRPRASENNQSQQQLPMSPKPDSPTQTNFPFTTINNQQPPLLGQPTAAPHHQAQQQYMNQSHYNHNIFVSNALHPNCPIESRCINLDAMFSGIIECINQESDSDVLKLVLDGLPGLLANKSLVLTATDERINQLCLALSNLILPNKASNRQIIKIDIVKCSLKCLTSLLIYRKSLDHKSTKTMLSAFEYSLQPSKHPTVPLFTTCLIELQDSSEMTRFIPIALSKLCKFSPTVNLGISMLEFLSYLILFPKLYENFSEDEYKFIFAIALPYTNPFRFSDYITCLAFRVIAMWYLNCRPSLRCVFVDLVKKSLQNNVIQPFKENPTLLYSQTSSPITQTPPITYSCPTTMSPVDQRKRSSSLNTENCIRHHQAAFGFPNPQLSRQVNEELIETFADLLSRYTHGQYLAVAPKNRCTEMLVDRSTSQTWLQGNSLVTITAGKANNGWAEIMIRRPTGNTSWIGRLQNTVGALPMFNQQVYTDSLNFGNDIISLFSTISLTSDDGTDQNDTLSTRTSALSSIASTLSNVTNTTTSTNSNPPSAVYCKNCDPILLPKEKKVDIALSNFDLITPYETHKVGVIYVGANQADNRAAILSNKHGSPRYYEFLRNIGTCIILNDIDPEIYFIGGLDVKGDDGKYAYFWKDNVTQVIFHVATFMLPRDNDPQCNNKNRHIGNDHVCISYNDSGSQFKMSTIKGSGHFIKACIVISPLDGEANLVEVEMLPDLSKILGDIEPRVLSNLGASLYARQMAIHLNVSSMIEWP